VVGEYQRTEIVVGHVEEALRQYLSPVALPKLTVQVDGVLSENWQGWPFGRNLYMAEIFSLIQRVPGVKHVMDVQLNQRPVTPSKELPPLGQLEDFADALVRNPQGNLKLSLVSGKVLFVPADTILCSLDHEIEVVEL
jgi:hypothetical protein